MRGRFTALDPKTLGFGRSALVGVATGGIAFAIVQGGDWGWTSIPVLGLFSIAAVAVLVVALRVARHPDPIVPLAVLRVSSFRIACLGGGQIPPYCDLIATSE